MPLGSIEDPALPLDWVTLKTGLTLCAPQLPPKSPAHIPVSRWNCCTWL